MLRKFVQGFAVAGVVFGSGALGAGCLDRPVTAAAPTIKTNFTSAVNQTGINKVDILFDIDNSASMGDKQTYLIQAIPQMISRLVTPNCIDDKTGLPALNSMGQVETADPGNGTCPSGSGPEFSAVHDMHIGVVTSSLGPRLGIQSGDQATGTPVCGPEMVMSKTGLSVSAYNDDQGHLINRTAPLGSGAGLSNAALASSEAGGFLYWYPALNNTGKDPVIPAGSSIQVETSAGSAGNGGLVGDFTELVGGAGESGCGIESQLESWYRFLIQPDPYSSIVLTSSGAAWSGIDTTIIQQRHDFLRPDSLVAIIVLTDENDSEIDVRSFQGTGYQFMSDTYTPPRATAACFANPNDPNCHSCGSGDAQDPSCSINGGVYTSGHDTNDWGYDLNLRHVHMQQKYALSPQFPLTRYYNGLTSATVPNRFGEYPSPMSGYAGNNNCTNPLFAKVLPQASDVMNASVMNPPEGGNAMGGGALCALAGGAVRTPADVFYAHIGGVPHQLLQSSLNDMSNPPDCPPVGHTADMAKSGSCGANQYYDTADNQCDDCPQKDTLLPSDWKKILGQGPAAYSAMNSTLSFDYTGIDPHMIESETPRMITNGVLTNPPVMSSPGESTLSGPCPVSAAGTTVTPPCPAIPSGGDPIRPDPINGREWTTNTPKSTARPAGATHSLNVDRQYACIFQLPPPDPSAPMGSAAYMGSQRDCAAIPDNTIEENSCDCVPLWTTKMGQTVPVANPTGNLPDEIPPLCSKTSTDSAQTIVSAVSDYTVQTYAKAYPTIRELMLANMMGGQGIVSSLCPIHTLDNQAGDDPLYGYRPAVNAIVNRLKSALGSQCVPTLTPDSTGNVPCLVLVTFGKTSGGPSEESGCAGYGGNAYGTVDPEVLSQFQAAEAAAAGDGGTSTKGLVTCSLNQSPVPAGENCATTGGKPGWCYVTGAGISAGSTCSQQISYSSMDLVPNGATISLQCISTNTASGDGGVKKDAK